MAKATQFGVTLEQFSSDWMPAHTFHIFCFVEPTKRNGLKVPFIHMVGKAKTKEGARAKITQDKIEMGETFGGLIDAPGSMGRHYRILQVAYSAIE